MVASPTTPTADGVRSDWVALARELGPRFAAPSGSSTSSAKGET
jgi:hypothetical protein